MRLARLLSILIPLLLAAGIGWVLITRPKLPSTNRRWAPDHARLARAEFHGERVLIRDVRNFRYSAEDKFEPDYYDKWYDLRELSSAWYVVTPFSTQFRGPAHTFVSFGFGDSSFVAISVEARREAGEQYGLFAGIIRRFEVAYVIGDERDLLARRALYDGGEVYLYPIRATPEAMRQVFVEMLQRANQLLEHPEFYNTITNNCTSNLIDHVNRVAPRRVDSGIKTMLPGYSDGVALSLGLIDSSDSLDVVRERYRINERAARGGADEGFSRRVRAP